MISRFAHRDRGRTRHATFTRAARRGRKRFDRLRHVRIRHDDDVVLRATVRLHAFAVARACLVNVFATGVEPTNEIAFTFGCVSSASTHSRPPCARLSTPFGNPAFSSSSMIITTVSGTFSLGFSTNVFPQRARAETSTSAPSQES